MSIDKDMITDELGVGETKIFSMADYLLSFCRGFERDKKWLWLGRQGSA